MWRGVTPVSMSLGNCEFKSFLLVFLSASFY